jgi:hypothetical protein
MWSAEIAGPEGLLLGEIHWLTRTKVLSKNLTIADKLGVKTSVSHNPKYQIVLKYYV